MCAGVVSPAIRVHARDAQSVAPLSPIVTAVMVEYPNAAITVRRLPSDSTIADILGEAGLYELRVSKTGYADVTQRVRVESEGGRCAGPLASDITVVMVRASPSVAPVPVSTERLIAGASCAAALASGANLGSGTEAKEKIAGFGA